MLKDFFLSFLLQTEIISISLGHLANTRVSSKPCTETEEWKSVLQRKKCWGIGERCHWDYSIHGGNAVLKSDISKKGEKETVFHSAMVYSKWPSRYRWTTTPIILQHWPCWLGQMGVEAQWHVEDQRFLLLWVCLRKLMDDPRDVLFFIYQNTVCICTAYWKIRHRTNSWD